MRLLSSAIIVLAGSIPFAVGATINTDTGTFANLAGGVVALIGWGFWMKEMFDGPPHSA